MKKKRMPIRLAAALALSCCLSACSSGSIQSLNSENDIPAFSKMKDLAAGQGSIVHRIQTVHAADPDLTIAVHETGNLSAHRTIVLVHGAMSDHGAWRFVQGDLGQDHRLLMVDLPGSGDSDRPRIRKHGPDGMGPRALADRVLQAIRAVTMDDDPDAPMTFVGHSLGGTVLMRMFGDERLRDGYADVIGRADRMVLLAPADVDIESPPSVFEGMASVSGWAVTLGDLTGLLESTVADGARQSVCNPDMALREEAERICDMLTDTPTRRAHQQMLIEARPLLPNGRLDRHAVIDIVASYANIDVPCLIVWGARDAALPVSMGYKLLHDIPGSELYVVDDCRHSVQIEHPAHCASVIRRFSVRGSFNDGLATQGDHILLARQSH